MLRSEKTKKTHYSNKPYIRIQKKTPYSLGIAIPIFWGLGCWDHHSPPPEAKAWQSTRRPIKVIPMASREVTCVQMMITNPALDVPGS